MSVRRAISLKRKVDFVIREIDMPNPRPCNLFREDAKGSLDGSDIGIGIAPVDMDAWHSEMITALGQAYLAVWIRLLLRDEVEGVGIRAKSRCERGILALCQRVPGDHMCGEPRGADLICEYVAYMLSLEAALGRLSPQQLLPLVGEKVMDLKHR
jgi:hypothetical protein